VVLELVFLALVSSLFLVLWFLWLSGVNLRCAWSHRAELIFVVVLVLVVLVVERS
jgi:hypothetical protein